jgi:cytochrome c556
MLFRSVVAIAAIAIGVTAAMAQQDPIAARKALMKQMGGQSGQGAKFMKGEEPFDLTKAKAIFATFAADAEKAPTLFPDTAKTGGETAALPAIWEKTDDFKARFAKFAADAKAAEAKVTDEASFKAEFSNVGKNCGGCHELYRAKKS